MALAGESVGVTKLTDIKYYYGLIRGVYPITGRVSIINHHKSIEHRYSISTK